MTRMASLALSVLLLGGCGGNVDRASRGPVPKDDDSPESSGKSSGSAEGEETDLGDCVLGYLPDEEPGKDCDWMFGDRCYETKLDACSCACPDRRGTSCVSGFPEPDGRVLVSCY